MVFLCSDVSVFVPHSVMCDVNLTCVVFLFLCVLHAIQWWLLSSTVWHDPAKRVVPSPCLDTIPLVACSHTHKTVDTHNVRFTHTHRCVVTKLITSLSQKQLILWCQFLQAIFDHTTLILRFECCAVRWCCAVRCLPSLVLHAKMIVAWSRVCWDGFQCLLRIFVSN